ncbi:MAG: hypothetical protein OHK0015_00110 [Chloroflexi bacterium OHK40]
MWIVAVITVGVAAFIGGQQLGQAAGQANRLAAQQQFLAARGGPGAAPEGLPGGPPGGVGAARQGVAGVVQSISADSLTLTLADGSTRTLRLAEDVTVRKEVEGTLSDLVAGERVVAFGTGSGDTFEATALQVGAAGPDGRQAEP